MAKPLPDRSARSGYFVYQLQSIFELSPILEAVRFKRSERAIVEVSEQWEATKLLGALSEHGEMKFFRCESNFNSEVTIHFLRALQEDFDEDLIVVVDNAPYFASKKVKNLPRTRGLNSVIFLATRHK